MNTIHSNEYKNSPAPKPLPTPAIRSASTYMISGAGIIATVLTRRIKSPNTLLQKPSAEKKPIMSDSGPCTLYDIDYRDKHIEVKETSYDHSWQTDEEKKSKTRTFGITKARSKYKDTNSDLARQSDLYVFCLNTGMTKAESDPLELTHWEFYIIKTEEINKECGDAKTISLSRLQKLVNPVPYDKIKETVGLMIAELN